jgi:stearoyl-CoA desaturase (delta-9 desaturase)
MATNIGARSRFQRTSQGIGTRRLQGVAMMVAPFLLFALVIWALWGRGAGFLELALFAGMYAVTTLGITVGYHRYFTHRGFRTSTAGRVVLAILGSMAIQGSLSHWTAVHRKHHAHTEQTGDPHSPYVHGSGIFHNFRGLWHSHLGWMFVQERFDEAAFAQDILRDRLISRIQRLYVLWVYLGFAIPAVLGGILTASWAGALQGLLWGGLIRLLLLYHSTWSINSICHVFGSRPFRTGDRSTNNVWLSLLTFGESWHNNHHAFPSSARHGLSWWQVDLSGLFIRTLQRLGLVWDVKVPAARQLAAKSSVGFSVRAATTPR